MSLPSAPEFRNASIQGDEAHVSFKLPPIARFGIEGRFGSKKQTRIEGAFFYEAWSFHDAITISPAGNGIQLRNVTGFPDPYVVGTMSVQKHFRDTFSVHGGIEHQFMLDDYPMVIRAGASYERSAIPNSYLSVQTVDLDKVQIALGGSLFVSEKRNLRLDIVYAHTFGFTTDVDPHDASVTRVHVVRANYPAGEVTINGGRYTAQADVLGVGLNWKY
jgi:long-chain fatty acid transport protein